MCRERNYAVKHCHFFLWAIPLNIVKILSMGELYYTPICYKIKKKSLGRWFSVTRFGLCLSLILPKICCLNMLKCKQLLTRLVKKKKKTMTKGRIVQHTINKNIMTSKICLRFSYTWYTCKKNPHFIRCVIIPGILFGLVSFLF